MIPVDEFVSFGQMVCLFFGIPIATVLVIVLAIEYWPRKKP